MTSKKQELIAKIKKCYKNSQDCERAWRESAKQDLRFCHPDLQWDAEELRKREMYGLKSTAVDRIGPVVKQIVNQFKQSNVSLFVSATDSQSDADTADIMQGLIRHIQSNSGAGTVYSTAYDWAVKTGRGFIRIRTDFASESSFEQEIILEPVVNPLQVYWDASDLSLDGSDAEYCIVAYDLSEESFKIQYGDKVEDTSNIEDGWSDGYLDLGSEKTIRVLEYIYKVHKKQKLHLLEGGETMFDPLPEGVESIGSRDVITTTVKIVKTQGFDILEEVEWPSKYLPLIPVYGEIVPLEDGHRDYIGMVRSLVEPQKALNIERSDALTLLNRSVKAPWIVAKGSLGNDARQWANADQWNTPYLEYETIDPETQQPYPQPQRIFDEAPITQHINYAQLTEADIKSASSTWDPVMGATEQQMSGTAIGRLQTAGAIANYHFTDSMARALRIVGKEFLELLPKIYDTPRVVRILDMTEKEKLVGINGAQNPDSKGPKVDKIFDVTTGRYDVTIEMGANYATKRKENQVILLEALAKFPMLAEVAGDKLLPELLDSPITDELVKRMERALPPNLMDSPEEMQQDIPPAIRAQMDQVMQQLQQLTQANQQLQNIIDTKRVETDSKERIELLKAETAIAIESLRLGNAQMAMKVSGEIDQSQAQLQSPQQPQQPQQPTMMEEDPEAFPEQQIPYYEGGADVGMVG